MGRSMRSAYGTVPALFHYIALGVILYSLKLCKLTNGQQWDSSIVLALPWLMYFKTWRKPLSRFSRLRRIPYVEECRIYVEHYFYSSKLPPQIPQIASIQHPEYHGPSIVDIFPQEIIDRIIDCLVPDDRLQPCPPRSEKICKIRQGLALPNLAIPDLTFLSCALVCRAFRPRSQYHMWRSLHVRSAPRLRGVVSALNGMGMEYDVSRRTLAGKIKLMQDHPRFACAVKHVQICLGPSNTELDRRTEQNAAKTLLQTMTNAGASVTSICLQMRNSREHDDEDLFELLFGPHLNSSLISALHLREIGQFPLPSLARLSSLCSLSLCRVESTSNYSIGDSGDLTLGLPRIEALRIGADAMVTALRMLGMAAGGDGGFIKAHTSYLDTSYLTHLDLIYTDLHPLLESGLEEVTALLTIVGGTVTHLRHTFDQFCMGGLVLNYADLRQTPILRVLDVMFSCEWLHIGPAPHTGEMSISIGSLSAFLSNLAPGTLEILNITFAHLLCRDARYPPKSILSMEWHRLDEEIRRICGTGPRTRRLLINLHINYMGAHPDVSPIQVGGGIGIAVTPVYAKWRALTKAACCQLFGVELLELFPLANTCPGVELNISYSTGTENIDEFIDALTNTISTRGIPV